MRRRASLLIFVVVSRAPEHREEPPHIRVRSLGPVGLPPQARLDRGRLEIDGLRIALHTLRHGLNADGLASLVTWELGRIVACRQPRRMTFRTQLANKNY